MNSRDLKTGMIVYHAFLRGLGKGRVQSVRSGCRSPHRFFIVWADADTCNWFRAGELHKTLRRVREKTLHARRKPFVKPVASGVSGAKIEVPIMKNQPPQATKRTNFIADLKEQGICERAHNCATSTDTYTQDELDFMMAMDRYKREHRRPFPTWSEVLGVLHDAGWRKVAEPTQMPGLSKVV